MKLLTLLFAFAIGACALPEPRMPSRVSVSTPVYANTDSGDSLRGWRGSYEIEGSKGWSMHGAAQLLESPDHDFPDGDSGTWDEVDEAAFGARHWRELGPVLVGIGGEVGAGNGGSGYWAGDDDYGLLAAIATVRWDLPMGAGALSFNLDVHYRWTYDFDARAVGTGVSANDAFSGWAVFLGAGWTW